MPALGGDFQRQTPNFVAECFLIGQEPFQQFQQFIPTGVYVLCCVFEIASHGEFSVLKVYGLELGHQDPSLHALFRWFEALHQQIQRSGHVADGDVRLHTLRFAPGGWHDMAYHHGMDDRPERAEPCLDTQNLVAGSDVTWAACSEASEITPGVAELAKRSP